MSKRVLSVLDYKAGSTVRVHVGGTGNPKIELKLSHFKMLLLISASHVKETTLCIHVSVCLPVHAPAHENIQNSWPDMVSSRFLPIGLLRHVNTLQLVYL